MDTLNISALTSLGEVVLTPANITPPTQVDGVPSFEAAFAASVQHIAVEDQLNLAQVAAPPEKSHDARVLSSPPSTLVDAVIVAINAAISLAALQAETPQIHDHKQKTVPQEDTDVATPIEGEVISHDQIASAANPAKHAQKPGWVEESATTADITISSPDFPDREPSEYKFETTEEHDFQDGSNAAPSLRTKKINVIVKSNSDQSIDELKQSLIQLMPDPNTIKPVEVEKGSIRQASILKPTNETPEAASVQPKQLDSQPETKLMMPDRKIMDSKSAREIHRPDQIDDQVHDEAVVTDKPAKKHLVSSPNPISDDSHINDIKKPHEGNPEKPVIDPSDSIRANAPKQNAIAAPVTVAANRIETDKDYFIDAGNPELEIGDRPIQTAPQVYSKVSQHAFENDAHSSDEYELASILPQKNFIALEEQRPKFDYRNNAAASDEPAKADNRTVTNIVAHLPHRQLETPILRDNEPAEIAAVRLIELSKKVIQTSPVAVIPIRDPDVELESQPEQPARLQEARLSVQVLQLVQNPSQQRSPVPLHSDETKSETLTEKTVSTGKTEAIAIKPDLAAPTAINNFADSGASTNAGPVQIIKAEGFRSDADATPTPNRSVSPDSPDIARENNRVGKVTPISDDLRMRALERQVVTAAREGANQIRMQLYPPGMGQVLIKLALDGSKLRLQIKTSSSEATASLNEVKDALRTALGDSGFTITSFDVTDEDSGRRDERRRKQNQQTPIQNQSEKIDFSLELQA